MYLPMSSSLNQPAKTGLTPSRLHGLTFPPGWLWPFASRHARSTRGQSCNNDDSDCFRDRRRPCCSRSCEKSQSAGRPPGETAELRLLAFVACNISAESLGRALAETVATSEVVRLINGTVLASLDPAERQIFEMLQASQEAISDEGELRD